MLIEILQKKRPLSETECDTLALSLFEGADLREIQTGNKTLDDLIAQVVRDWPGRAKLGETAVIHTYGIVQAKRVILTGLGKKETVTIDKIRQASAIAAREAQKLRSGSLAVLFRAADAGLDSEEAGKAVQAIVEGTVLGTYRFEYYKTENKDENKTVRLEKLLVLTDGEAEESFNRAALAGSIVAESVNYARDLTNHPAQYMTPDRIAAAAGELAARHALTVTVLDREEMRRQNMNALLAVAQGSAQPPKLIALKYEGNPQDKEIIGFVGKGITFDSGGISLKPPGGMDKMIRDMAGAAAVLGAVAAIARLKLNVNVLGVLPCTENMPSGAAYRPGDIITSMSGKTIEVLNTDAEGRLILADAVTYAKKEGATSLVDLATLTGACVTALGTVNSGVIANDKDWCGKVLSAAAAAGEKMWELPNDEEYLKQIKSTVADLKNTGGKPAGTITAGLFIGQFAGKTPWVHIDIAGTSDADKTEGYNVKGATGVGIRTLVELAKNCQKS